MDDSVKLKEDYTQAKCCGPQLGDKIVGFLKYDSTIISIHKPDCDNLKSIEADRIVKLDWDDVFDLDDKADATDDPNFKKLDEIDFKILKHHLDFGVDYAAVVAKHTRIDREKVFKRHKKLRDMKLLVRVQPKMIQYRKNMVKGKWIKHRNHTYYELTDRGKQFLIAFINGI